MHTIIHHTVPAIFNPPKPCRPSAAALECMDLPQALKLVVLVPGVDASGD